MVFWCVASKCKFVNRKSSHRKSSTRSCGRYLILNIAASWSIKKDKITVFISTNILVIFSPSFILFKSISGCVLKLTEYRTYWKLTKQCFIYRYFSDVYRKNFNIKIIKFFPYISKLFTTVISYLQRWIYNRLLWKVKFRCYSCKI